MALTGADIGASYDIANAVYDSVSFSVAGQGGTGRGLCFNNDGTKMYYLSDANNTVYQYSLSTAFNVGTATYDSLSFDVSVQDSSPCDLNFNADGTKVYVMGFGTNSIYQYSLSSAFNISTASYDSVSFSVGSQEGFPFGFTFSANGTKMFMVGINNDRVYQYSLSSAFDLSTAVYDSISFSVGAQETGPSDIAFNSGGTKMYITGFITDAVYQYSLSSAFDLSSASYDSVSFSVSAQSSFPHGVVFNNDGTKLYVLNGGGGTPEVFQYTTGTSDIATITYPASVKWSGGTAPASPADGETDLLTFYTEDGGNTYYGFKVGDALA